MRRHVGDFKDDVEPERPRVGRERGGEILRQLPRGIRTRGSGVGPRLPVDVRLLLTIAEMYILRAQAHELLASTSHFHAHLSTCVAGCRIGAVVDNLSG